MELIKSAMKNLPRTAMITEHGSYRLLFEAFKISNKIKSLLSISKIISKKRGPRIGLLLPSGPEYISATWATWLTGCIVVPMATSHTKEELDHVIHDANIPLVLTSDKLKKALSNQSQKIAYIFKGSFIESSHTTYNKTNYYYKKHVSILDNFDLDSGALIIYTSGTTGKPKGALHTHKGLLSQMNSLSKAWHWHSDDVILHALPLHHIHGIVNALYCANLNGACVIMENEFSPKQVWHQIQNKRITLFMAVPTMYSHLITYYDESNDKEEKKEAASKLRLYISGSSACPIPIMNRWENITGCKLLERYGMTEIGMALSNPYKGERIPGYVGLPLPGVQVKIVSSPSFESGNIGELYVKGDTVFCEYWNNSKATLSAFDSEGYFKTGDTVMLSKEKPYYYKILGRTSVDIIKSGGYKLSALEIESIILELNGIKECCIIGVPDDVYGEIVTAIIVLNDNCHINENEIKEYCQYNMAKYKVPRYIKIVKNIPKNAMSKINKKLILNKFLNNEI